MELNKIKCIIVDFDKTLYSNANLSGVNDYYAQFLFEYNLIEKTPDAVGNILKQYPNWHMEQCVYFIARQNGIKDAEIRNWFNNHVYNILCDGIKIVSPDILKKLCESYPVFILSDSAEAHLEHYMRMFDYDKSWFAGIISNDFKLKSMSKCGFMEKIVKKCNLNKDEVLMVGDSLRSDIKVANEAGIESFQVFTVSDTEKLFNELIEIKG